MKQKYEFCLELNSDEPGESAWDRPRNRAGDDGGRIRPDPAAGVGGVPAADYGGQRHAGHQGPGGGLAQQGGELRTEVRQAAQHNNVIKCSVISKNCQ